MSGGTAAAGTAAAAGSAAAAGTAAATTGITLADVGLAASLAGTAVSALGSMSQGNAAAAAANYNSQIASENAQIAQSNASMAGAAGEAQVGQEGQKTRATVGAELAAQGANNIDVNSGSAVDVRSSAASLGELSAINIRSNAARTAYGYQTQAASDTANSQLDTYQGQQAQTAGDIGAGAGILSGVGNAGLNYAKYVSNASINPGTGS